MPAAVSVAVPAPLARVFAWRRVRVVLVACLLFFLLMAPGWKGSRLVLAERWLLIGAGLLAVFGLFERWPRRLPRWIARWALQVAGVAATIPLLVPLVYSLTTLGDAQPWWHDKDRIGGCVAFLVGSLLVAPWMAVAALLRQIRDEARHQAMAFELERSEYERQALDARLRLLQAQVEPHFLFNTLANVRELVDSGSPQASAVLASLIAYLRAAVPHLHDGGSSLAQEFELVRAYLDVMHMRMPDRLQFAIDLAPAAAAQFCPPMSVLTLVENAVRHGIDPSEQGGRIDVRAAMRGERCTIEVTDTGLGFGAGGAGLGTGLANLRERLQLAFAGAARLELVANTPRGVRATLDLPRRSTA